MGRWGGLKFDGFLTWISAADVFFASSAYEDSWDCPRKSFTFERLLVSMVCWIVSTSNPIQVAIGWVPSPCLVPYPAKNP